MAYVRVSPPKVFAAATRAAKPPLEAAGSADAYRQTTFVLGKDLELVLAGLQLEGTLAEASSGSKHRTQRMASALGLWSRAWLTRLEALHAAEWGNYVPSITLVRAAADYQASALYLLRTGSAEWQEWLDQGGIALAPDEQATEYQLHAFRAAEILAAHDVLGPIYTTAMDLSLSHFGATLMLTASDSAADRVAMTFGDRDFHLGLAEIVFGWLLQLGAAQLEAVLEFEGVFAVPGRPAIEAWCGQARQAASTARRCQVEGIERQGMKRYLVWNWRRSPGAAPKKLLL